MWERLMTKKFVMINLVVSTVVSLICYVCATRYLGTCLDKRVNRDKKEEKTKSEVDVAENMLMREIHKNFRNMNARISNLETALFQQSKDRNEPADTENETMTTMSAKERNQLARKSANDERANCEYRIQTERYDKEWDNAVRSKLDKVLSEDLPNLTSDYDFLCRSTICKLEVANQTASVMESSMKNITSKILKNTSDIFDGIKFMTKTAENGNKTAQMYFFKKGVMQEQESI
jgi:hypothetical protein